MSNEEPEIREQYVNLLDSEVMAAAQIQAHIVAKYAHRPGTYENLQSMTNEVVEMFEKIGLRVKVDYLGAALAVPPKPPEVEILGRIEGNFDHERKQWEVRKGVADDLYKR